MTDIPPAVPPPPGGAAAAVALYDDGGLDWRPVSGQLATARMLTAALVIVPLLVIAAALALVVWSYFWVLAASWAALLGWLLWLIPRQVQAMSYAELPEELVIRSGRIFRKVVSIPYGRLQYADMASGPLQRKLGIATVTIHTASPQSGGTVPGLPLQAAEDLRERLTAMGEAQRAGL